MTEITYLKGDATQPIGNDKKVICHIANDLGAWGAGFVLALSKKWKEPEAAYKRMRKRTLGQVQFVLVSKDTMVANMIGQHGVGHDSNGNPPIRYDAVRTALKEVNDHCTMIGASIHAPRFGCGLAGGKWEEIEKIIQDVVTVPVYIYDFN